MDVIKQTAETNNIYCDFSLKLINVMDSYKILSQ